MFLVETYDKSFNLLESLCFSNFELLSGYLKECFSTYSNPVFRIRRLCFDDYASLYD